MAIDPCGCVCDPSAYIQSIVSISQHSEQQNHTVAAKKSLKYSAAIFELLKTFNNYFKAVGFWSLLKR
jgi:hypothetical protein